MKWIPSRDLKIEVDCLSRVMDLDDYALNVDMFRMLDVKGDPHFVVTFASSCNTKLARFNSTRFYQPGAVDVSTHDCEHENNWLVSPLSLILRTINNLKLCKAEGSIVVSV